MQPEESPPNHLTSPESAGSGNSQLSNSRPVKQLPLRRTSKQWAIALFTLAATTTAFTATAGIVMVVPQTATRIYNSADGGIYYFDIDSHGETDAPDGGNGDWAFSFDLDSAPDRGGMDGPVDGGTPDVGGMDGPVDGGPPDVSDFYGVYALTPTIPMMNTGELISGAGAFQENFVLFQHHETAPGVYSQEQYVGIEFEGETGTGAPDSSAPDVGNLQYGWLRLATTWEPATSMITHSIVEGAYDNMGNPIAVGARAIPEPSSLVSLLVIATALGGYRWSRRRFARQN